MSWQPIETAPKDGTEIDIWHTWMNTGVRCGARIPSAFWGNDGDEGPGFYERDYYQGTWNLIENPTNWMPIPAPPTI